VSDGFSSFASTVPDWDKRRLNRLQCTACPHCGENVQLQDIELHYVSNHLHADKKDMPDVDSADFRMLQQFPELHLDTDDLDKNKEFSKAKPLTHRLETYNERLTGIPTTSLNPKKAVHPSIVESDRTLFRREFPSLPKTHVEQDSLGKSLVHSASDQASSSKSLSGSKKKDKKVLFRFG
jgi:hypothetical protein